MTYSEQQTAKYHSRSERFAGMLATDPPPMPILAEEGALIIDALVAIAGPEVLLCYARNAWQRGVELDGMCPWDHDDDRTLHPVAKHGMCAACLRRTELGQ